MIAYEHKGIFTTRWTWFAPPADVSGVAEAAYFSYDDVPAGGFKKKAGITTVIDLSKDEMTLWEAMREKFIRRQIRRGETAGISVRKASQDEFMKLYRRFRTGSGLPKERMAEALAHGMAFAAGTGEEVLAVGLFLGDGTHARAHVLASVRFSNTGSRRELVGYANRVLIWHVMRELKRGGYHELDLGGIAPDSANAHQRSLAEFKEAFGGERRAFYYYRKTYSPLLRAWRRLTSLI